MTHHDGRFTGEVWLRSTLVAEDGTNVGVVHFAPGARTHWHRHPGGQFLAVTDGSREVSLWDTTTGTKVRTWNWRIGDVRGVAFAPDGLTCAVGSVGRFAVFDVDV